MSIANRYIRIARAYLETPKTIETARILELLKQYDGDIDKHLVEMFQAHVETLNHDLVWNHHLPANTAPQKRIVQSIISISTLLDLLMMSIIKQNGYFTGLQLNDYSALNKQQHLKKHLEGIEA